MSEEELYLKELCSLPQEEFLKKIKKDKKEIFICNIILKLKQIEDKKLDDQLDLLIEENKKQLKFLQNIKK